MTTKVDSLGLLLKGLAEPKAVPNIRALER
jgi:hypothetical protein